jgi:predicted nucleotide-binding protein
MTDFDPKEKAARIISKQLLSLEDLKREISSGENPNLLLAQEQLQRWKDSTVDLLSEFVSDHEARELREKRLGSYLRGQPIRNLLREIGIYEAFLTALNDELNKNAERVLRFRADATMPAVLVPSPSATRMVFIIHGHDELNLLRLEKLLAERWNLSVVILKEKAGKGRTLIEKFENEATQATFAIALMSPDDFVQLPDKEYTQARPNAVFELGWFCGRLGRERMCILLKRGTMIHSDLEGISRIEFNQSVEEKLGEIEKELKAGGLI